MMEKRSQEEIEEFRHLADPGKIRIVQNLFGEVLERTVLYRGEDCDLAGGIRYRNVNAYLKTLKRCH